MNHRLHFIAILGAAALAGTVHATGSNTCGSSTPISGTGTFEFDNGAATTDGLEDVLCDSFGSLQIDNDVWFSWTSDCEGDVTISTCGGTAVDTKLAVYDDACGGPALDCNDDDCGLQSTVVFAASCGNVYLVRIGTFPGASGGAGTVTIDGSGSGCGEGCGDCNQAGPAGAAGCSDQDCQALICGGDPFCCDTSWDQLCADAAAEQCACEPGIPDTEYACPSDCTEDGTTDVNDLNAVILDWGTDGSANGGDVDDSGLVGVDDLIAIIIGWGPCPSLLCQDPEIVPLDEDGTYALPDWTLDDGFGPIPHDDSWLTPIVIAQTPPPGTVFTGPQDVSVHFAVSDGVKSVECTHVLELRDLTPPEVAITGVENGDRFSPMPGVTPEFTTSDPTAELIYWLDDAIYLPYEPITDEGLHTLRVTAVDDSGNATSVTKTFMIAEPPTFDAVAIPYEIDCADQALSVRLLLAAADFDVRDLDIFNVGLNLYREDGMPINDISIPLAGAEAPNGAYDHTTVEALYEAGYWDLHFEADLNDYVSVAPETAPCPKFLEVVGTGRYLQSDEFEFSSLIIALTEPLAVAILEAMGLTNDDESAAPPAAPGWNACTWKLRWLQAPTLDTDTANGTDIGISAGGPPIPCVATWEKELTAHGGTFEGWAKANDWCSIADAETSAVVISKAIMRLELLPRAGNCCTATEIQCFLAPSFKVKARRNDPGLALAAGKISIASTCGAENTAVGGLQLGDEDPIIVNLGVKATTGGAVGAEATTTLSWDGDDEKSDPVDAGTVIGNSTRRAVAIAIVAAAQLRAEADAHAFNWYASGKADIYDASPGITIIAECTGGACNGVQRVVTYHAGAPEAD